MYFSSLVLNSPSKQGSSFQEFESLFEKVEPHYKNFFRKKIYDFFLDCQSQVQKKQDKHSFIRLTHHSFEENETFLKNFLKIYFLRYFCQKILPEKFFLRIFIFSLEGK